MKYIRLKNLVIDWNTMGCSQKSFNREGSDDGVIVQNGKLFGFNRNENGLGKCTFRTYALSYFRVRVGKYRTEFI